MVELGVVVGANGSGSRGGVGDPGVTVECGSVFGGPVGVGVGVGVGSGVGVGVRVGVGGTGPELSTGDAGPGSLGLG